MGIISELESIRKFLLEAGKIELYNIILNIQETSLGLQEENKKLKQEILDLREKLKIKGTLIFMKNKYFLIDKNNKIIDGPFCTRCWDKNKELIRLHERDIGFGAKSLICPECKNDAGPK